MLTYEPEFAARDENRQRLRAAAGYCWVTPDQWRQLLVSHGSLVRADFSKAGVRGLLDRESGERFVIEEERLLD
ncbi:MAG: hypothetical protein WD030_06175 [Pirellulales bacterium]